MKNEEISRLTYEVDRAVRGQMGQTSPPWARQEASLKTEWRSKVASLKGNEGITPQTRHDDWVKDMITAGWKQGSVVDHDKKTHPSICQYGNLPDQVHLLDELFVAAVETCIEIGKDA